LERLGNEPAAAALAVVGVEQRNRHGLLPRGGGARAARRPEQLPRLEVRLGARGRGRSGADQEQGVPGARHANVLGAGGRRRRSTLGRAGAHQPSGGGRSGAGIGGKHRGLRRRVPATKRAVEKSSQSSAPRVRAASTEWTQS